MAMSDTFLEHAAHTTSPLFSRGRIAVDSDNEYVPVNKFLAERGHSVISV